jgi:thioredoxin reductase (NADPH)
MARKVDNFPGIPPASPGVTVVEMLWEHLGRFPPKVVEADVGEIYHTGTSYGVSLGGASLIARALVLATGTLPKRMGVPGEDLPWVHHMWTDVQAGPGSTVAVVGGGDLAVDQALSLHDDGASIIMLLRSQAPRCNLVLSREMEVAERLEIRENAPVLRFEDRAGHAVVVGGDDGEGRLPVDAVLVSIGREPALPRLNGEELSLSKALYLAPEGLFCAGDLVSEHRRQVAIAMGSGLDAAMRVDKYFRRIRECD